MLLRAIGRNTPTMAPAAIDAAQYTSVTEMKLVPASRNGADPPKIATANPIRERTTPTTAPHFIPHTILTTIPRAQRGGVRLLEAGTVCLTYCFRSVDEREKALCH